MSRRAEEAKQIIVPAPNLLFRAQLNIQKQAFSFVTFRGSSDPFVLLSWGFFGANFGAPEEAFWALRELSWGLFWASLGLGGLGRGPKPPRGAQGRAQGPEKSTPRGVLEALGRS